MVQLVRAGAVAIGLVTALGACGRIGFDQTASSVGDAVAVGDGSSANDGSTASDAAISVTLVSDDFGRTVGSGWGNADVGGAWVFFTSTGCTANVSSGYAIMTMTAGGSYEDMHVPSTTALDTETRVTARVNQLPASGSYTVGVMGRDVLNTSNYALEAAVLAGGAVHVRLIGNSTSGVTTLASAMLGSSVAPNTDFTLSLIATGASPTMLCGRVWLSSSTEPTACTVNTTDSTPTYQVPGISYVYTSDSDSTAPTVSYSTFRFLRIGPQ
jgi:hypothetical protein